ncbi:hypothetical protein ACP275_14G251100 [Erythranthe tilingii]
MAAERYGEEITGIIPFQEIEYAAATDFGIVDFMDNDLDHLIQLVQVQNQVFYLDTDDSASTFVNGHLYPTEPPPPENHQLFVAFDDAAITSCGGGQFANKTINTVNNQFQNDVVSGERDDDDDDDDNDDVIYEEEEESSETTTNTSEKKQKKGGHKSDRTKTLISERRRRGRMKEKLYALRALVPYITKMDKASIVGDAVLYVQDLQMQAKKLKSEIAGLESEVNNNNNNNNKNNNSYKFQGNVNNSNKSNNATTSHPIIKKIIKMDVFQVEERGFYVRIVLQKGKGVAVLIYKAIESITTFNVQTSNLAADSDNYIFTFTLNIREGGDEVDMNLACLKLWVASLFLNQGFEFETLT